MRKYIFQEIILKEEERLAARSATRIALDIVCNLPGDETADNSKQSVRCPVVAQKPVVCVARVSRVPVSPATARVENLVAQEGGSGPDGRPGDCRVEVVVAREESGVARLVVVASLRSSTGHEGKAGCEKKRRKHFAFSSDDECLYEGQKTSRKGRIELSTKVRQDRGGVRPGVSTALY